MAQTFGWVLVFLLILIALPFGIKWIQRRGLVGALGSAASSRVITAVAVGPHQRVVTVEVGPEGRRTWLVLGVTTHSISCLHTMPAETPSMPSTAPTALV
jgi:flagellar protein FliO/FliZ